VESSEVSQYELNAFKEKFNEIIWCFKEEAILMQMSVGFPFE
jgi:hypothetical protein